MFAEDIIAIKDQKTLPCPECGGAGFTLTPECPEDPFLPSTRGHVHNRYRDMGGLVRCTERCTHCEVWEPGAAHVEQLKAERAVVEDNLREDWWPSEWHLAEHPVMGMLYEVKRKHSIRPTPNMSDHRVWTAVTRAGKVTSDNPLTGYIEDMPCTVPAYLVGTPIEHDEYRTVVRYEYVGSTVDVVYTPSAAMQLRFSHPWDDDLSTQSML